MSELFISVPLVPPSVNHYKKPRRGGRHWYVTDAALAFKEAVVVCESEQLGIRMQIPRLPGASEVEAIIYLGAKQKGDVDNFGKVILDSLQEAGIIESDAKITDLILRKRRDRANPRTEIFVRAKELP